MINSCDLLLVEPDPLLAETARKLFTAYGVVVWTAHDAASALDLASRVHFDCAVIEVTIWQGMQGVELARRLKQQLPKLRVALTTGLRADEVKAPLGVIVFQKPYRFDAVAATFCGVPHE